MYGSGSSLDYHKGHPALPQRPDQSGFNMVYTTEDADTPPPTPARDSDYDR